MHTIVRDHAIYAKNKHPQSGTNDGFADLKVSCRDWVY